MSTTSPLPLDLGERIDLDTVVERLRIGVKRLDSDWKEGLIDAELEYGMDVAPTLTLTLFDPDEKVLHSNLLRSGLRASVRRTDTAGWDKFALVRVASTRDNLHLTFEDEAIWRLRRHRGFLKANRDTVTRAEFAYMMVNQVTHPTIDFFSPQLFVRQPIASSSDVIELDERNQAEKERIANYGFSANESVKFKKGTASAAQRTAMKDILDVGVGIRAAKSVLVAAILAYMEGSIAGTKAAATRFYKGPKGDGVGGAIGVFAANRNWLPWKVAWRTTGRQDSSLGEKTFGRWLKEARADVNAYLGSDAFAYKGSSVRKGRERYATYEFMRGDPDRGEAEDTWTALLRLADEVKWRCFAFRNTVYFVNDEDLQSRPHVAILSRNHPSVVDMDFDFDVGQPVTEVTAQIFAERFRLIPGKVVLTQGLGAMVDRYRWLVSNFRRSLFYPLADLTLRAPIDPEPEPAPEVRSDEVNLDTGATEGEQLEGTVRGRIVDIAKSTLSRAGRDIHYEQRRPIVGTLKQSPVYTDCSGFATVVYRDAGAPDPNGHQYDGQGYTGTLWSYGRAVSTPKPGDLAFYGNPSSTKAHVAIVINASEAIGLGSEGGPRRHGIKYRSDFAGYRTYPLDS